MPQGSGQTTKKVVKWCVRELPGYSLEFPKAFLTLNVPTTHICVEIYDVILTRNCGELLGLGHWCFISNDLT